MSNVLDTIVAHKRQELAAQQAQRPLTRADWEPLLRTAPPPRDFVAALREKHPLGVIAEVKRASPSAGLIRPDFDPAQIAQIYALNGAACISVLTDAHFFQGSLDDLKAVRRVVDIPVLRKDFILDRVQILEARAAGADCILLIAECLDDTELSDLYDFAASLGMQTLIEIYEPENLDRVLKLNPPLLGVNNRNLKTMVVDLQHSLTLRRRIPADVLFVSESGIQSPADTQRLINAGVHSVLVGETLMRAKDIGAKLRELLAVQL